MRHAWLIFGALAGCSSVATQDTEAGASTGAAAETGNEDGMTGMTGAPATPASTGGEAPTGSGGEDATSGTPATSTAGDTEFEPTGGTTGGNETMPTVGCGADPGVEGAQDRVVEIAGVERKYIVVVPPGYDSAVAHPLVFAWHGRGSDGKTARLYFKIEEASDGAAILVYPDGLPLADMDNQTGWDLTENGVDVALFDAMLIDVSETLCVDSKRVFSAGHSFGGFMSNTLGCFRGGVVRGIAPVAGGGPFGQCTGQVAAWLAHGTVDMVVDFMLGEDSRDHWIAANGCDAAMSEAVTPAPCVAYAGCDEGFPVHWCQHDDPVFSGHTWPAWAGQGIWKFFAAL